MHMLRNSASWYFAFLASTNLLSACATTDSNTNERSPYTHGTPNTCSVLRMEHVETESQVGYPINSTMLLLTFTPPAPGDSSSSGHLSTKVRVQRELVSDLRARLDTDPEVICTPDPKAPGGYQLNLD